LMKPSNNTARIGLVQHAAVVYENSGLFFKKQGNDKLVEYNISEAFKSCTEWVANGGAKQMIDKHDFLNSSSLNYRPNSVHIKGRARFSPEISNQMKEIRLRPGSLERVSDISDGSRTETSVTASITSNTA